MPTPPNATSPPPVVGAPPTIEWVAVDTIRVDDTYQRAIDSAPSRRLIERIARGWDWRLFDPIRLSRRDDGVYVIDGQHRLAAARLRGDLPHLPAIVGRFDGVVEEARLFVSVNTARKNPTTLDKFRARCAAGDPDALAVNRLIEAARWTVGRSPTKIREGEVVCVGVIQRLHRRYGPRALAAAMTAVSEAFPGEGVRAGDELFPGLCLLLSKPPPGFGLAALADVLKAKSQPDWVMAAQRYRNDHPTIPFPDEAVRDMLVEAIGAPSTTMASALSPLPVPPPSITRQLAPMSRSAPVDRTVPPVAWQAARTVAAALGKPVRIIDGVFLIGTERFTPGEMVERANAL